MHDQKGIKLSKWAFFLGDLLLLGVAVLIHSESTHPMDLGRIGLIVFCVAAGAFLAILPFLAEYRLLARLAQTEALSDIVGQVRSIEQVAEQISSATARWQGVQEVADRVAGTSKAIAERMSAEARAFTEFMHKANDSEKATLRLETEKLKRAEGEWVHVMVRMLDHVYALHLAGVRSGQPNLIVQLDQFQYACRDVARRIGLSAFAANPTDPFDSQRHQLPEGVDPPPAGAMVAETIATGYTFQGRLLRPALVRLQGTNGSNGNGHPSDEGKNKEDGQKQLQSGDAQPAAS